MRFVNQLNVKNYDWQTCYSSQLYGTFFSIFAKPKAKYDPDNIDVLILDSIELRIVNYKGILNLGIVQAEFNNYDQKLGGTINIELQALHNDFNTTVDCKNQRFDSGKSLLKFHRFLKPMHPPTKVGIPQGLVNGVFDTEFFYREGLHLGRDQENETDFPRISDYCINGGNSRINRVLWENRDTTDSDNLMGDGGILCPFSFIFFS